MTAPLRTAQYLRVSTVRQAEHDVSIPDQKRQGEAYCALRGYQLVETYVKPAPRPPATAGPRCGRRRGICSATCRMPRPASAVSC